MTVHCCNTIKLFLLILFNVNALQGKSQVFVSLGENETAAEIYRQIEMIKKL